MFLFLFCFESYTDQRRDIRKLNLVPVVIMLPCGTPFSFSPFNPQTKETNKKQNKKKQALPLILPSTKKKRVAVALAASTSLSCWPACLRLGVSSVLANKDVPLPHVLFPPTRGNVTSDYQ
jgi:hypothetical protein